MRTWEENRRKSDKNGKRKIRELRLEKLEQQKARKK